MLKTIIFFFLFLCFWLRLTACGNLVPRPGVKPTPPALEQLDRQGSPKTIIFKDEFVDPLFLILFSIIKNYFQKKRENISLKKKQLSA